MFEPGDHIDIWVVEKALGSGGMGSVYRCHNREAQRIRAAIKVLDPSLAHHTGIRQRFINEATILHELDHPNIVRVRNVRINHEPPYLEMEFVEGESLDDRLRGGALSFADALALMQQMISAVGYLHQQNICHRDIKPANVLIRPDGTCKLVDFGLAVETDRDTRITEKGVNFGTVAYAPPEWTNPEALDPQQWDLYALGVVWWEMLTGKVAFPSSGKGSPRQQAMQVMLAKQQHEPLDPGEPWPTSLRALIGQLTHSLPEKRPQQAREVAAVLAALAQDAGHRGLSLPPRQAPLLAPAHPTAGPPPTPPPATVPAASVAPLLPWMVGGVGLAALILGLVLAVLGASFLLPAAPTQHDRVDLVVTVVGLPADVPAVVRVNGQSPVDESSFERIFLDLAAGTAQVRWAVGDRSCLEACVTAPTCPIGCQAGEAEQILDGTQRRALLNLPLQPPPRREVWVRLPEGTPALPVGGELAGQRAAVDGSLLSFTSVAPGEYPLRTWRGSCEGQAEACTPCAEGCPDACPPGCVVDVRPVEVGWETGRLNLTVELGWPAAERPGGRKGAAAPLPGPPVPAPPVPTPPPAPAAGGGALVTNAQFARWLQGQPTWQREAAVSARRADAGYLEHWGGDTPPAAVAGSPLTHVNWSAAAAYCRGAGGLAPLEAAPERWTEGARAPGFEWRVDGTRPAWRSSTGETATGTFDLKATSAAHGVRCRG